ncbi:hypothetical protein BD410DRAFT_417086 [Rickenella mellea]|uniref:Pali-domain-containing protein n=1 Tax=Rickenella mellea TaxID=50990 RepID=A0A4Y7QJF8_9AGAM|nr:hypothetical protein BD410DRAFT_417086 [Rickenella mellea]
MSSSPEDDVPQRNGSRSNKRQCDFHPYGDLILIFVAFLILLIACESVPISQSVNLFDLHDLTTGGTIKFGVWGFCFLDRPVNRDYIVNLCSTTGLGWSFSHIPVLTGLETAISTTATSLLVFHTIACTWSFLTFLLTLALSLRPTLYHRWTDRAAGRMKASRSNFCVSILVHPLLFSSVAAVLTTLTFIIDLSIVLATSTKVKQQSNGHIVVSWGSVTWIVFLAALILWLITILFLSSRKQYVAFLHRVLLFLAPKNQSSSRKE